MGRTEKGETGTGEGGRIKGRERDGEQVEVKDEGFRGGSTLKRPDKKLLYKRVAEIFIPCGRSARTGKAQSKCSLCCTSPNGSAVPGKFATHPSYAKSNMLAHLALHCPALAASEDPSDRRLLLDLRRTCGWSFAGGSEPLLRICESQQPFYLSLPTALPLSSLSLSLFLSTSPLPLPPLPPPLLSLPCLLSLPRPPPIPPSSRLSPFPWPSAPLNHRPLIAALALAGGNMTRFCATPLVREAKGQDKLALATGKEKAKPSTSTPARQVCVAVPPPPHTSSHPLAAPTPPVCHHPDAASFLSPASSVWLSKPLHPTAVPTASHVLPRFLNWDSPWSLAAARDLAPLGGDGS